MDTTNTETPKKTKKSKGNVTKKDADLSTLAKNVATAWQNRSEIGLIWKASAEFWQEANNYTDALSSKGNSKKDRPKITSDLKACNKALDEGIAKVKKYIDADAANAKDAQAIYAKFGIVRANKSSQLPIDRDNRQQALKLILPALTELGYDKKDKGKAYFSPLIAEYNDLINKATETDKIVSGIVGSKNKQKENITKVLNALIHAIKANYPDTHKSELRAWGFQKDKY